MRAVWWESATVMDKYLHVYLLSHLMISGSKNRYFLTPFFWWGYWAPKMLGKWLGLLKLEVAAQEATPALLGDLAMSSPWVTFSYSAIQSRGRRRYLLCCTQQGPLYFLVLFRCSCRLEAVCYSAACVDNTWAKKKEHKSHCLFWGVISLGPWTSGFILLPLWLAWDLSIMRCYGFDSKIYLDEWCSPSMVKVISFQQRRL